MKTIRCFCFLPYRVRRHYRSLFLWRRIQIGLNTMCVMCAGVKCLLHSRTGKVRFVDLMTLTFDLWSLEENPNRPEYNVCNVLRGKVLTLKDWKGEIHHKWGVITKGGLPCFWKSRTPISPPLLPCAFKLPPSSKLAHSNLIFCDYSHWARPFQQFWNRSHFLQNH